LQPTWHAGRDGAGALHFRVGQEEEAEGVTKKKNESKKEKKEKKKRKRKRRERGCKTNIINAHKN
jgi:hypothetical protein